MSTEQGSRYLFIVYEVVDGTGVERYTTETASTLDSLIKELVDKPWIVYFKDKIKPHNSKLFTNQDALDAFFETLSRNVWKPRVDSMYTAEKLEWEPLVENHFDNVAPSINAAVDPKHYKDYILDMQWIDAMSRIPTLRSPVGFKAALELQIRKYLDRRGQKDNDLQELKKSLFYLKYLIAYIENGNKPVFVKDIKDLFK